MAKLFAAPFFTALDSDGDPISGAALEFFRTGTSSPLSVFTDSALLVAHTNPVVADSAGRFPAIYLQAADYKVFLKDAAGVTIKTIDPLSGNPTGDLAITAAGSTTSRPLTERFGEFVNVKDHGAQGDFKSASDGVTGDGSAVFSAAGAAFTSEDVGKVIAVPGVATVGKTITNAANGPADKVWQEDSAGGPAYLDLTAPFNDAATGDVDPFPASEAVGDRFIIGHVQPFSKVTLTIGTAGVGGAVTWKYWDGSAWTSLAGVTDDSSGLTAAAGEHDLIFTLPGDWAKNAVNGSAQFYIAAEVTTVYATNPVLDRGILSGGRIRVTAADHGFIEGQTVGIKNILGTSEANGFHSVAFVDANSFDLPGLVFANAYVAGGTAHGELQTTIQSVQGATSLTMAVAAGIAGTGRAYSYFTDNLPKFQAAVDSTANSGIRIFFVPDGSYGGDLLALSLGSRNVVWTHLGDVTYSTSKPPGVRLFDDRNGNVVRPWIIGDVGFANDVLSSTGLVDDPSSIFITRSADHTGGTGGGSVVSAPLKIKTFAGTGVKNYETGVTIEIETEADGDPTTPPNFVGIHPVVRRKTLGTSTARIWGANFVARDESLRASDVQLGGVTGVEINIRASGPDTNNVRQGLTIFPSSFGTSPDGPSEITAAIRISPSVALGDIDIRHGLLMDVQGGGGSFTNGITLRGPFSGQAIDINQTAQTGIIRLGGTLSAGVCSQLQFVGHDSGGARTIYSKINGRIVTNTDTSEDGGIDFNTVRAGTDTIEGQIAGGMVLGTPTGSFKGVGTLNAKEVYNDNVALTCAPVEHAVSGKFSLKKWDKIAPSGKHHAARAYDGMLKAGYQPQSADGFADWLQQYGAVPGLITPVEWEDLVDRDEKPGLGTWGQRLALGLDCAALAIVDLNRRLKLLESKP